ncbi:MAG: acyl carrier protein [Candidatus Sulfotelmatobacter sp.]
MSDVNGIHPSIRSFILKKFPAARKRDLKDDLSLLESGIIDSLGVLDVVGFLEQTFNIKIDDDELTPDNFANINCMVSFVQRKSNPGNVVAN